MFRRRNGRSISCRRFRPQSRTCARSLTGADGVRADSTGNERVAAAGAPGGRVRGNGTALAGVAPTIQISASNGDGKRIDVT